MSLPPHLTHAHINTPKHSPGAGPLTHAHTHTHTRIHLHMQTSETHKPTEVRQH